MTASQISGLLLDLDGVFYIGHQLIDGAIEAIEFLRQHNIPRLYITNTTTRSQKALFEKMQDLGLPIDQEEILSAPQAALDYLKQQKIDSAYLLLRDEVKADFQTIEQKSAQPQAVVIGDIGSRWRYALLNQAFLYLMDGAQLIALHKNKFWQAEEGLRLDIGAFVAGLEYATDTQAIIIGKPSPAFFEQAVHRLGLPKNRIAMLGDDIDTDVGGAQAFGLQGILVKTGKYRASYAQASGITPDAQLESIADLPALLTAKAAQHGNP